MGKIELVSKKAVFFFRALKKKQAFENELVSLIWTLPEKKNRKKKHNLKKKTPLLGKLRSSLVGKFSETAFASWLNIYFQISDNQMLAIIANRSWALGTNRKINLLTAKRCNQKKYRKTDFTMYYIYVLNIIFGFFTGSFMFYSFTDII